jgi:FtsZ-binding cell division protein ZapB
MTIEKLIRQLESELKTLQDLRTIKLVQMQIDNLRAIQSL